MYQILVVDDEQNVLNALRRELQSDYAIETFSSPQDALQKCQQSRFDLVIVDYQMPTMNGI
jgi:CheY-like chemotaxis protein